MQGIKAKNITLSRILILLKESKLTYKEFAYTIGVSQGNFTDWKMGRVKPYIEALRKISKTYKVQLEWLTGDTKYRTREEEFVELCKKETKENE